MRTCDCEKTFPHVCVLPAGPPLAGSSVSHRLLVAKHPQQRGPPHARAVARSLAACGRISQWGSQPAVRQASSWRVDTFALPSCSKVEPRFSTGSSIPTPTQVSAQLAPKGCSNNAAAPKLVTVVKNHAAAYVHRAGISAGVGNRYGARAGESPVKQGAAGALVDGRGGAAAGAAADKLAGDFSKMGGLGGVPGVGARSPGAYVLAQR